MATYLHGRISTSFIEIETLIEEAEIRLYNIRQKKISANNR